jgi:hypothetical protein
VVVTERRDQKSPLPLSATPEVEAGGDEQNFRPGVQMTDPAPAPTQAKRSGQSLVTAAMIEYWHQGRGACCGSHAVDLAGDDTWYNHWNGWQSVETYAQSKGLEFWPGDYIGKTELSQCRYLRGSYLLDWNGKGSIMLTSWNGTDFWNSCTAADLGFPSDAKYRVARGVWRRDYTRGYVIVNPTKSTVRVGSSRIPSGDAILHQN